MRRALYVGLFVLTAGLLTAQQYDTSGRLKTACEVTNTAVPVSGTVTANVGSGTQPVSGTVTCDVGAGTQAVSGTVTVTATNLDVQIGGSDTVTVTDGAGAMNVIVDSGTVTANAGTGTFTVAGTVTANAGTGTMATDPTDEDARVLGRVKIHDGTDTALVSAGGALVVDGSAVTQPISAASLPLPTGAATAANQDGIIRDGTGDTTQANVVTGRLAVDGSGVTQPVSGTVTVTATNLDVQIGGSDTVTVSDGAGAMNVIVDSITAGDNNIGNVDVVSMPTTTVTATNLDVQIGGSDSLTIGTFPDNEPINVAQRGGSAVAAGPCEREVPLYAQIDQTAGEQLITGTASERIYVCSIAIVTATAQNIALVDGTGSVCATTPTGLLGGSTAATGQNFAANGGWVLPHNIGGWAKTSTDADNVCLLQSSTGQISGVITYVSVPNI